MDYDIIVIGAGPAGLSFARSLKASGLRLLLLEKQSEASLAVPDFDGRDLALTHLTRDTMRRMGVWQRLAKEAVSHIWEARVLDGSSPLSLDFDAPRPQGAGKDLPLGYMVSNHHIRKACYDAVVALDNVDLRCEQSVKAVYSDVRQGHVLLENGEQFSARLVVAADTRFSAARRQMGISASMRDFGHTAMVCRVVHEKPHNDIAWELFQYGRTLAMLPQYDQQSSVVLTLPANQLEAMQSCPAADFTAEIGRRFDHRLGAMKLVSERFSYPLIGVYARRFVGQRFALIGDAAVGMHPVTAHGFNLGLQGQATLAGLILEAHRRGAEFASAEVLQRYERQHQRATRPLYLGTNTLVSLFTDDRPPARALRKSVIQASRLLPPVKWLIQHKLGEMPGQAGRDHWPLPTRFKPFSAATR